MGDQDIDAGNYSTCCVAHGTCDAGRFHLSKNKRCAEKQRTDDHQNRWLLH